MKLNFFTKMALGLAAAFTVTSCIDDDNGYYVPNDPVAYGFVVNASPNSGDLYFFADANQINETGFPYNTGRGYYNFRLGDRKLSLKTATGETLATADITLKNGEFFSAFAVNTFDDAELVTYKDSLTYPASGNALVRFINLSPDAPAIDISSSSQSFGLDIAFKEATDFISVPSGSYGITFKNNATGATIYTAAAEDLLAGNIYTIYTKGFVSPPAGSNDAFSTKKITNYNGRYYPQ